MVELRHADVRMGRRIHVWTSRHAEIEQLNGLLIKRSSFIGHQSSVISRTNAPYYMLGHPDILILNN